MKRKLLLWISIILLVITAVTLLFSHNQLEEKHEEEIRRVISSNGGGVVKIERVEPEDSPFADDFNKSNVVYKITYHKRVQNKGDAIEFYSIGWSSNFKHDVSY
ncbi:hypothetical protein [Paenibacillus tyrfis]|uniref:DUF3139 domain-containing protein n=1 Tax=Paenibacillus tyrfis TaxID=1501230 RepID=A0A081NYI7_9BACL|nr:hypothetical protein [Paenibacillus tyrfis]KEQ23510.1 hypothetical protein ET33_15360 [Paenibacillus tyrfis]